MATSDIIDQRLTNLEIKAAYTEDLVDHLDKIIAHQQQQIAQLLREMAELHQPPTESMLSIRRSIRGDLPPHF